MTEAQTKNLIELKRWGYQMFDSYPANRQYYAGFLVGLLNIEAHDARERQDQVAADTIDQEIVRLSGTRNKREKRSGILVFTDDYESSHGRPPKGRGSWAFRIGRNPQLFWHNGLYAEARAAAKNEARRQGVTNISTQP